MKGKRCPLCKNAMVLVDDIVSEIGGLIFIEKGFRCQECGEEFIPEEESQRMIKVAKKMNLWGEQLELHSKLSKSGRGTVLRIPADIENALKLNGDEDIKISKIGKNRLLIEII
jgi:hypothetical protein